MQTADSKIHDYLGAPGILTLEGRASIGSHATAKLTKHLLRRIVQLTSKPEWKAGNRSVNWPTPLCPKKPRKNGQGDH